MSDHYVRIEFKDGYATYTLVCEAPPESFCHAEWDCTCESFGKHGIDSGRPWHETRVWGVDTYYAVPEPVVHYGRFNPEDCDLVNFFDDMRQELIEGEIRFPVQERWVASDEAYIFDVVKEEG